MSIRALVIKPTNEQLATRRHILQRTTEQNPKLIKSHDVIKAMRLNVGYEQYNKENLRVDRLHIKALDTFVSDLALYTYSNTIHIMFDDLEEIKNKAREFYDSEKGFVKINALKIGIDVVGMKEKILSGKALDVSVELLGKRMRSMIEAKNLAS